jgi:hypothetical protein
MMKWVRRALGMGQEIERQRLLFVTHRELPEDVFALVRITHFGTYGLTGVMEVKLVYGDEDIDDMIPQFTMIVAEALQDGADVSIATSVDPSLLGLDD